MACGDVLSLEDLQTAKKHQIFEAEVITGKAGGVAGGAPIGTATNPVTGQTQQTLPSILADLGFDVQSWTSSSGGVLASANQVFLNDTPGSLGLGDYYAWGGTFEKPVPAGTDPALPGGGYIMRSSRFAGTQAREALRRSYAEAGFNLVDGSFEAGGTLVNASDVLLQERTGKAFSGPAGTVAAGTNPAGGGFVDRSGDLSYEASRIICPGGDAAIKMRGIISAGLTPLFADGVHYFSSTVADGDGNQVFALLPNFGGYETTSKNVVFRPTVPAYAYFVPQDVAARDITYGACTAYGIAEGGISRIVNKFNPARAGDAGRIVRMVDLGVNTVDFDEGRDSYSWSTALVNTDSSFCGIGYHFRYGEAPPTSLRLLGIGATSCTTAIKIDRITYGTLLNPFADDADVGIQVGESKNLTIISPGFEFTKQLAIIGTDDYTKPTVGLNWIGGFVWQRHRKSTTDAAGNYGQWGVEVFQTFRSSFDFSGIDYDWFKRNEVGFIKFKECFNIVIDGMPPEYVYVVPGGSMTYDEITIGPKCRNEISSFYVSNVGVDSNNGDVATPFKTFAKLNFALMDTLTSRRQVRIVNDLTTPVVIKNKRFAKSAQRGDGGAVLQVFGSGGNRTVAGLYLESIAGNLSDCEVNNIIISANGYISDCAGVSLNNITVPTGVTLFVSGGCVDIKNATMQGTGKIQAQNGAQLRLGNITGGNVSANAAIVYKYGVFTGVTETKFSGGQIFQTV